MSSLASWTYVNTLTVWPCTPDAYGQPQYGTPYSLMGDWQEGGEASADKHGTQFMPASTYYFEAADGAANFPRIEDRIIRGDYVTSATPVEGAETIRKVGGWAMGAFGADELPDWKILT
jgi:hypothetical protein